MSGIGRSFAEAGVGERLARVAGGEHVDRFDRRPIDGGEVRQVRHREPVLEHGGRLRVVFADPHRFGAVVGFGGEVEPAVPGAERAELHSGCQVRGG